MSEDQNIKQQPADHPEPTDAEAPSLPEENKSHADEATHPSLLNLQPHTSEMEVHHHGHVHEKKKWKEYVFQFFMLFLAVFCGFLAEYQLEQTIERHREKDYISLVIQDLKSDTADFKTAIQRWDRSTKAIDTLFTLLKGSDTAKNTSRIYYLARMVIHYHHRLNYNARTFEQLKYSGNFRLIKNANIADSITSYYQRMKYIDETRDLLNDRHTMLAEESNLIFDSYIFQTMVKKSPFQINPPEGNPPLMPHTAKDLNKYLERLTFYYVLQVIQSTSIQQRQLQRTERLLRSIKKEYKLND
ncbi:MAG TPA: hypothetical protein VF622_02470 [Segetibacter sp.]|jgi:hypothetical protein